jgi:hypothetical protein
MIAFAVEAERIISEAKKEAEQLHEEIGVRRRQIHRIERTCDRYCEKLAQRPFWRDFQ